MSEKKITIRLETKDDYRNVENLTREAFWNVYRPGCMEYYVLHCYRDDPAFVPELDFVMELDGELIGQVIYVWSEIDCDDGRKVPIMTFGPIGIAPAYKRQGYGKKLLDYSMEKAKEMGAGALAITGNIDFYGKSGFVPAKIKGIRYADDPEADYFLIKELTPGFLDGISGTYKDPEGYFVCEKNPEAFEAVIRCMKESGIGYGAINHPVDRDPVCGHTGIIGDYCPQCGRKETKNGQGFERIRRITGYLVGTTERFNNAKAAEVRDRVKHSVSECCGMEDFSDDITA